MNWLEKFSSSNTNLTEQQLDKFKYKIFKNLEKHEFLSFSLLLIKIIKENTSFKFLGLNHIIQFGEIFLPATLISQIFLLVALFLNYARPKEFIDGKNIDKYNKNNNQIWHELDIKSLLKSLIEYDLTLLISTIVLPDKYFYILLLLALTTWIVVHLGKYIIASVVSLLIILFTLCLLAKMVIPGPIFVKIAVLIPLVLALKERQKLKKGNIS